MGEPERALPRMNPAGLRSSPGRSLAVVPVNCRFDHMAVNQRLRALLDISDVDIIASYPDSFPRDIAERARIRSFPATRRAVAPAVRFPLFAMEATAWAVAKRLAGRPYEFVYTFQDVSAVAGWLLGPLAGRWAMDVLDDPGQSHGNAAQRRQVLKSALLQGYERIVGFLLRRADVVFTIGLTRDDPLPSVLSQNYRVAGDRIFPLRQSVDVQLIRESAGQVSAEPETNGPRVSFVGYVSRLRGVDTLIRAAIMLRGRGVNVELVLVGHLNKRDHEWLMAARHSLPSLRYLGVLPSAETLRAMSGVTVGVLPFPYRRETAPVQAVTGIEYLALGKPIVATDLPGARALVDHYVNGVLVPPGDAEAMAQAIEEIVTNPGLAKEMGEASLKKAEAFDAPLIRKEVIRVLRDSWQQGGISSGRR
jgi:glycosyltransferase involved in cell wall biosynthesis